MTTENPAYQTWRWQHCLIYGALLTTLSNEVASLVSQTKTSHGLWTLLKNTYAKASRSHLKQLKEHLRTTSKGTQSITTYMHSLEQTGDLLASLVSPFSIEDMTDYILCGLDDGYRADSGVNARDNSITFDDLLEKLIIQELLIMVCSATNPCPSHHLECSGETQLQQQQTVPCLSPYTIKSMLWKSQTLPRQMFVV